MASRSLFFDVQVQTLLSEKYTLFARANLCKSLQAMFIYFQQYMQHIYLCIQVRWDEREAFHVYKPTVQSVTSCSLFFDIQIVTLGRMGEILGRINLVCTYKSLLPHYQAILAFFQQNS